MPAMPSAAWTRHATTTVRAALEPVLREMAFRGSFPTYRRTTAAQVELVEVDVRIRTGITIALHSLPPRSKQGTWRSERQRHVLAVLRSSVAAPALTRRIAAIAKRFRREADAFWRARVDHWTPAARSARHTAAASADAVAKALLAGGARKLAALARDLDAKAFLEAVRGTVSLARLEQLDRAAWKCARVLLRYPWLDARIGGSLAVTAATSRPSALARDVLRWTRPHASEIASRVAFTARATLYENPSHHARARALFALVLDRAKPLDGLSAADVVCLLYVLAHAPNAHRPSAAILRRVLAGSARMARNDPHVRTNLACLRADLPPSAARLPWEGT
ncbi:MAG: hypothetical protein ACTHU0_01995 [Kofleriaceae bacterium]